jgi:hypothetical protein
MLQTTGILKSALMTFSMYRDQVLKRLPLLCMINFSKIAATCWEPYR